MVPVVVVRALVLFVVVLGVVVVVVPIVVARVVLVLRQPWFAAPPIALIPTKGLP